ncbi:ABC transporter ATP-binding protein [Cognatishimia sp. 1_MG-2023]|uniref:ABC transporter ATP-binding protein n=1 Tax=Cognatishimia sp. 1_MG-2023 TaxID=3062642 RepID=UPI0026E24932|nr:ABC transporter ATP-binding protein [Cognatishimia sp. 1_MG-2023]
MDDIVFQAKNLQIHAMRDDGSELPIVKGVDFKVHRGEVVALIGESGSGKTTISLSALGYCKPGLKFAGGQAELLGQDLTNMTTDALRPLRGQRVAYLAQSAAATFNPALKINEQVTEAPVIHGTKTQNDANLRALELYRALELPNADTIGDRYPHQVSGGQLQRLMAAMALCGDPDLLVLDEPTTALDVTTQIEVLKAFKKVIRDEGAAAIYVTHDLALVAQIADYIVVLYNGEIKEKGPTDVIINNPQHPYTKRLIAASRLEPQTQHSAQEQPAEIEPPALTTTQIDAGYGPTKDGRPLVQILHDVDLSVQRGQTVGVIGESGSGKSTLARVVAGLLPPASGSVVLADETLPPALAQRNRDQLRRIQFVYQMADTALNPRQRIRDILGRPLEFYTGVSGREKKDKIDELLEMVDLPKSFAGRYPHELSGGQKQRVNLARALAASPDVILCDEVTSALDSIVGANVIALLKDLRERTGIASVFISHDLSTVASYAEHLVVLYAGRVVESGLTHQVLSNPQHPYTRLLIASVPEMRIGWLEDAAKARITPTGTSDNKFSTASGCPFMPRCPMVIDNVCSRVTPPRRQANPGSNHGFACHHDVNALAVETVSPESHQI